jgi:RNA polymerase sigma factor (sigma-70 family)
MIHAYEQHRDELRGFFRAATRRKDHVEDLVQDVYVTLMRFPPRETVRDPAAYLFKVAWHLLQRFNKRARREDQPLDPESLNRLSRGWADDASAELAAEQQLVHLLKELPPLYGAVLILNRRDGLSYTQIGERLKISVSQVRRYLGLTLTHLKKAQWND